MKLRDYDDWGAGHWGASRDGGSRLHKGIDVESVPGAPVFSPVDGKVTKLGYVYDWDKHPGKKHLRYVEVSADGYKYRMYYAKPTIEVGDVVKQGEQVGIAQELGVFYPGITEHVHLGIRGPNNRRIDPTPTFHVLNNAGVEIV